MKKETNTDPKFSTHAVTNADPALTELFKDGIMDIYWAENHLVKKLPDMIAAAGSKELQQTITTHLEETKGHVQRLEEIFSLLGEEPMAKKCDAMEGLTLEGAEIIESTEPGTATRDVGIILASQKVEHYEIATYGGLCQLAKTIGRDDIAGILAQTLEEEKNADQLLTGIAEKDINYQATEEV
ncbi:ferritin-like domain-containing protein [Mucilaginibacter endophyticus]|uniref:YciE/YciF ferroxidase family protein n=1 Tax=Mucilaginibacter endophyticus TaxID=2675003 RepID=UPI000E0DE32F|nr:ferritin-like domain-containing protein [Mucilaginibacter endophyticus]